MLLVNQKNNIPNAWSLFATPSLIPTFNLFAINSNQEYNRQNLYGQKCVMVFLPGVWSPWSRKLISQLDLIADDLLQIDCLLIAVISQEPAQLKKYFNANPSKLTIFSDPHGHASLRFSIFDENMTEPTRMFKPTVIALNQEAKVQAKFIGRHLSDKPLNSDIFAVAKSLTKLPSKKSKWSFNLNRSYAGN